MESTERRITDKELDLMIADLSLGDEEPDWQRVCMALIELRDLRDRYVPKRQSFKTETSL